MSISRGVAWTILALLCATTVQTQERPQFVIRPPAQEKIILAVADAQPSRPDVSPELAEAIKEFNQVLWDDLTFAGFFTMAGKSFYPPKPIVRVEDVEYDAWSVLPFAVSFLSAGTLDLTGSTLTAELRIFDMKQKSMAFGNRIQAGTDSVRSIAHRWADEIVFRLTAGASRGIASTRLAFTSRRGGSGAKEVWLMDYDGHDQRTFTRNGMLNLFPMWSPDASKLAFVSNRTGKWEINLYSVIDGSRLPFPIFDSFASTPVISPSGEDIIFSLRSPAGDSDLFISRLDGSERRNVTNHPAIDTSPTWAPSGRQIAFISSRNGAGQLFIADSDGANVRRIVKEGGDADSPAWSPDGRWIAFHWKPRLAENYDLFLAEVSSGKIFQLTSGSGSNESPSWAPDSRHLAFSSTRDGTSQIYIMLADGSEVRKVTSQGANTSPSWGGYARRN